MDVGAVGDVGVGVGAVGERPGGTAKDKDVEVGVGAAGERTGGLPKMTTSVWA